jgi:predicted RNase H-like nuclease (RuvC/YqgF family)
LKHLIVGIDPGKTAAIACLDLDGNVIKLATERFAGLQWFVSTISQAGLPVVIACDKKRPDSLVERLAAIFDAVLFVPQTDISLIKKKNLTARRFSNPHERDALAAAETAYNSYSGKLRQAERLAREGAAEIDRVKALVIKKYSVDEAMSNRNAGRRLVRSMHG